MKPQKLTWKKVDQIRSKHSQGEGGYKTLGRQFGVSAQMIKNIIKNKSWPIEKRPR